ncbi:FxsA family membrane protein [Streptomyces sp. NPDC004609]|uniref:FxsA family membrane protein n=1 Tax=Streptomyces sp. NPDC004609 TaxID=3364704 RepID=UPI0036B00B28
MTTGTPPPTAPKRSRARRFVPLGLAAWLVLEIWLLILVGEAAGGVAVLALLIGGAVLGGTVIKHAGRNAFRTLSQTLQQQQDGRMPSPESSGSTGNGFLMLGGLLLMIPGLISDAAGLLLLIPPVRTRLGRYAERSLERRMREAPPGTFGDAFQQARIHRPDGKIVQGEVIPQDPPPPPDTPHRPLH